MFKRFSVILLLAFLNGCSLFLQSPPLLNKSSQETSRCIRDPECRVTFIVAHRGNGFGAPENSLEAARRAIKAGIPIIEVDLRYSRDYVLYALHDHSLKRTIGREGNLADFSSRELSAMRLKNSAERIPRFFEIYDLTKGRAVLMLDFKNNAIEYLASWIYRFGSFDDVIFYASGKSELKSAMRMKMLYPNMIVMINIRRFRDLEVFKVEWQQYPDIVSVRFPLTLSRKDLWHDRVKFSADSLVLPPPFQIVPLKILLANRIDMILTDYPLFLKSLL